MKLEGRADAKMTVAVGAFGAIVLNTNCCLIKTDAAKAKIDLSELFEIPGDPGIYLWEGESYIVSSETKWYEYRGNFKKIRSI